MKDEERREYFHLPSQRGIVTGLEAILLGKEKKCIRELTRRKKSILVRLGYVIGLKSKAEVLSKKEWNHG